MVCGAWFCVVTTVYFDTFKLPKPAEGKVCWSWTGWNQSAKQVLPGQIGFVRYFYLSQNHLKFNLNNVLKSIEGDDVLVENVVFFLLGEMGSDAHQELQGPLVVGLGLGQLTDGPVTSVHHPGHSEHL